jgi:ribosomal protein L11 methyltransferase
MAISNRSPLWSATAYLKKEEEEPVTEFFQEHFGSSVVTYCDMERGRTALTIYLKDRKSWTAAVAKLQACWPESIPGGFPRFRVGRIRQQDWAQSWKRHFKPLRIGKDVWVRPSWIRPRLGSAKVEVVLDPGLSFGTGHHPTTSFCLNEIVRRRQAGVPQGFLDIGTGSGILAITAAKLGYSPVEAFDIDPEAIRVANANARKNRVAGKINFEVRDLTARPGAGAGRYAVVCANLISDLIIDKCSLMLERLAPGGFFITAGILAAEFDNVHKVLTAKGLRMIRTKKEKEWRSGSFRF